MKHPEAISMVGAHTCSGDENRLNAEEKEAEERRQKTSKGRTGARRRQERHFVGFRDWKQTFGLFAMHAMIALWSFRWLL